jgi:hypothetical protein
MYTILPSLPYIFNLSHSQRIHPIHLLPHSDDETWNTYTLLFKEDCLLWHDTVYARIHVPLFWRTLPLPPSYSLRRVNLPRKYGDYMGKGQHTQGDYKSICSTGAISWDGRGRGHRRNKQRNKKRWQKFSSEFAKLNNVREIWDEERTGMSRHNINGRTG